MSDFDGPAAHRRGIRVVIDIVVNHTSDRHPWFEASQFADLAGDWYVWRDGAADGGPPNNWESAFGGPAWTFDARAGQWYYHAFYREQPDLNWRQPEVEARMHQVLKFWLDRGVDGFRLDAVSALFVRRHGRDRALVAMNMSERAVDARLGDTAIAAAEWRAAVCTHARPADSVVAGALSLRPLRGPGAGCGPLIHDSVARLRATGHHRTAPKIVIGKRRARPEGYEQRRPGIEVALKWPAPGRRP